MMIVYRHLRRSLVNHAKSNAVILVNLILTTAVVFVLIQNYTFLNERHEVFFESDHAATTYEIVMSDESNGAYASDALNKSHMFDVSLEILDEIDKECDFYAYSIMQSYLNAEEFADELVIKKYLSTDMFDQSEYVDEEIFSRSVFEVNKISVICDGEFDKDYFATNSPQEPLKVILGNNFREDYEIGDYITYDFDGVRDTAVVYGFTDKESHVCSWGTYTDLANSMIFPEQFPRVFGETYNQYMADEMIFRAGFLYSPDENIDVQAEINKLTTENGFYSLELIPTDGYQITETKNISEKNVKLTALLAVIASVICILSLAFLLYNRAMEDMIDTCIFLCCGIPVWKINLSLILEMLFWEILSILPTIAISIVEYQKLMVPFWEILLFGMAVIFISLIPTLTVQSKCNIDYMMRNKIV